MLKRRFGRGDEKFLSILIILAIMISIAGTFFSINMLNELDDYKEFFTGRGTSGQVNLTITQNLTINVIQTVINFSTGFVETGQAGATLNTTVPEFLDEPANWTNSTLYNPKPVELRNTGNVNCSVNITSGKDASTFIGGTTPLYQYNGSNKETASGTSCVETETLSDYTEFDTNQQVVCGNLGSNDNKDELYIHCLVWVPYDTVGTKEDQWTFTVAAKT